MIRRFLNGHSGEREKAAVRRYFTEHPGELEKYLTEESWSGFQPMEHLTVADSEKMLRVIETLTWQRRKSRTLVWLRAAAAAVLLLAVGAGFLFLQRKPAKENMMAASDPLTMEERVNNTGSVMKIVLPDSTIADIHPGSSISYRQPFGAGDREVFLEGQALFHVKHNAGKPFTVFAGNLGTTALGTVFRVKTGNGGVSVQLLSGKVVVRPRAEKAVPVYLNPGEKLYYDETKETVSVEQPATKPQRPAQTAAAPVKTEAPAVVLLHFENEPLAGLFKTIEAQYGMQVQYAAGALDNMYFTGVYNSEKESLADFLNTIALLNNVTIRINKNIIYITQ